MKKKLFLLLLIVALAAFVFTGCTPPAEGEGEGEGEIEGVLVEFGHEYRDGDKIYVAGGNNTVTVTFPAPVTGMVQIDLSNCTGDYSKGATYLFPNADRTVWTGSVRFDCCYNVAGGVCVADTCVAAGNDCCASTVTIISGACEADTCIAFPVIVDCDKPFAKIEVEVEECCCDECKITFNSSVAEESDDECAVCPGTPGEVCCGDTCSGLASWKIDVYQMKKTVYSKDLDDFDGTSEGGYDKNTFAECCEIVNCARLVVSCEGIECPIECEVPCQDEDDYDKYYYFAVVSLKDNVGNSQKYYAAIDIDPEAGCEDSKIYEGTCHSGDGMTWDGTCGGLIGNCFEEYDCKIILN